MNEIRIEIIDGLKTSKASAKMMKISEDEYLIEVKRYFMGWAYYKKQFSYPSISDAEDVYLRVKDAIILGESFENVIF